MPPGPGVAQVGSLKRHEDFAAGLAGHFQQGVQVRRCTALQLRSVWSRVQETIHCTALRLRSVWCQGGTHTTVKVLWSQM